MIEREPWKPRWLLVAKSCPGLEAGWHAIKDEVHYDTGERLGCGVTVVSTRRIETTDDVGYEPPADETCPGCLAWIERRNAR